MKDPIYCEIMSIAFFYFSFILGLSFHTANLSD